MSQYVRIKRGKQTFFFTCEAFDTIGFVKSHLKTFFQVDLNDMRLYLGPKVHHFEYML